MFTIITVRVKGRIFSRRKSVVISKRLEGHLKNNMLEKNSFVVQRVTLNFKSRIIVKR